MSTDIAGIQQGPHATERLPEASEELACAGCGSRRCAELWSALWGCFPLRCKHRMARPCCSYGQESMSPQLCHLPLAEGLTSAGHACSVGAHVRDAAAYVSWAFARAYAPATLAPILTSLAPHLLVVSCYDREVRWRAAAGQ